MMKKNLRRLIPLLLVCTVLFGGCTSPQKAEKQLTLDLKSAAFLLQLSGQTMVARYRMNLSENSVSLLSSQTVMTEESFQKQVENGKEYLVKNAEIMLDIQEKILPNAIIYITNLPSLGITQEHIDTMFENYRTASRAFFAYFNKAEKNGTKTNFKELETSLKEGTDALKKADETIQKLQSSVSKFITDYTTEPDDLGWKIAMKSNRSQVEQTQASNQLLTRCFDIIDLNILFSDFYSRFSGLIFRNTQTNTFPAAEITAMRESLNAISQKLTEAKTAEEELRQNADLLGLDSAAYTKAISTMQTTAEKADTALSAMESSKKVSQLTSQISEFEKSYLNLSDSLNGVTETINSCTEQLTACFQSDDSSEEE